MKITLQKWGAGWCPGCEDLKRAKTLEKFAKLHPEVDVQRHDDAVNGSKAWEQKADAAKVKSLPTLIWLAGGKELFRSGDVRPGAIERQYERALKAAGR